MYKCLYFLLIITALCLSSCTPHQRFVVVNNSDEEIMMLQNWFSFLKDTIFIVHPEETPTYLYKEYLRDTRIKPHSSRNIENWGDWMYDDSEDTTYIAVFNIIDLDTMSLEEFKSKFPIKHEFKVTLQDMIDRDWTLIYPPMSIY